jgi:hypothetical protein
MQYNQPLDQPSNPNASYVNGNPAAGIQGSIVSAESIEYDQREVVEVITRANVRGYTDFSNQPCAVPANTDMSQLRKAIEGFITNWQFIIDTEVTFTVHGSGADFPDLITAFDHLGKYRITPRGHVILQLAGAAAGSAQAVQYVYTKQIIISHANNDRISIFGAKMLAPVPRTDAGYAWNGPSDAQRAADMQTNLAILRSKFATELHFSGANLNPSYFPNGGIIIIGNCLMHLDGVLMTGDGSNQGSALIFMCNGAFNTMPRSINGSSPWAYDGLAAVNWASAGFNFEAGSAVDILGETPDYNFISPLIASGCDVGILVVNGGFVCSFGNALCFNNNFGFIFYPRAGSQWDGGVFCNANKYVGLYNYMGSPSYFNAPILAGGGGGLSHLYRNGQWGVLAYATNVAIPADYGSGANVNGGSIYAYQNAAVQIMSGSINYATGSSPPYGVVGNANSLISA